MKRDRKYQIDFTGLRFFLRAVEGRITRKELVDEIQRFIDESGAEITGTIRVEFRMTRRPTCEGPCFGIHWSGRSRLQIFVNPVWDREGRTPAVLMGTLGHELDHEVWEKQGKTFDRSQPYEKRPHEIRAWKTGDEWSQRWEESR